MEKTKINGGGIKVTVHPPLYEIRNRTTVLLEILGNKPTEAGYQGLGYGFGTCRDSILAACEKINNPTDPVSKTFEKETHVKLIVGLPHKPYRDNVENPNGVLQMLNNIEELLKFKERTFITQGSVENTYVFHMPKEWSKSSPFASLYALLVKVGTRYDGSIPHFQWLELIPTKYTKYLVNGNDAGYVERMLPKLDLFIKKGVNHQALIKARAGENLQISTSQWGIDRLTISEIKESQK